MGVCELIFKGPLEDIIANKAISTMNENQFIMAGYHYYKSTPDYQKDIKTDARWAENVVKGWIREWYGEVKKYGGN